MITQQPLFLYSSIYFLHYGETRLSKEYIVARQKLEKVVCDQFWKIVHYLLIGSLVPNYYWLRFGFYFYNETMKGKHFEQFAILPKIKNRKFHASCVPCNCVIPTIYRFSSQCEQEKYDIERTAWFGIVCIICDRRLYLFLGRTCKYVISHQESPGCFLLLWRIFSGRIVDTRNRSCVWHMVKALRHNLLMPIASVAVRCLDFDVNFRFRVRIGSRRFCQILTEHYRVCCRTFLCRGSK